MLRRESPDHRIQPRYRLRDHPLDRIAVRRHAPARPDRCRSQHQRVGQQHGQTLWARIPRGGATRQYRHVARRFRVREHADRSRRGRIFRQGGACRHSGRICRQSRFRRAHQGQGRLLRPAGRFEHHQNNRNQKPRIRVSGGHHSHNEIQSERDHSLRAPFRRGVLGHGADRAACCVLVRHERT